MSTETLDISPVDEYLNAIMDVPIAATVIVSIGSGVEADKDIEAMGALGEVPERIAFAIDNVRRNRSKRLLSFVTERKTMRRENFDWTEIMDSIETRRT